MEWLYADATQIVDNMIPSSRQHFHRQEFELSDLLTAAAMLSDLSVYLSTMPIFFWIFIITLVYTIVNLAQALTEIWIDEVIKHCGLVAHLMLFLVVARTWPVFIWYVIETFSYSKKVIALHQRTVQFHGMPSHLCNHQNLQAFCNTRGLAISCIDIREGRRLLEQETGDPRPVVEILFSSVDALQQAFASEALTPHLKMGGVWVRIRPKIGTNAALVEWWLVAFEYLCESVPTRYWLRATASCLVTMSLMKHVTGGLVWAFNALKSALGILGLLLTKIGMILSLLWIFFFVGYHAYEEIVEAHMDQRHETRRDRIAREPVPNAQPSSGAPLETPGASPGGGPRRAA